MSRFGVLIPHLCLFILTSVFAQSCNTSSGSSSPISPLFDKYFELPKDRLSTSLNHWKNLKLADAQKKEINDLAKALEHYQKQEFDLMIKQLNQLLSNELKISNKNELVYYLGIAYMANHQFDLAQNQFDQLENLMVFKYNSELLWYKALNHLAKEEKQLANTLLDFIIEKKVKPYFTKAATLQEALYSKEESQ